MKKILFYLFIVGCLSGCSLFGHSKTTELSCPSNTVQSDEVLAPHSGCPPAAFGAEKILAFIGKVKTLPHPTAKGDPVTGKKTSQKKGIRTGELDKPVKLSRAERRQKRREERRKNAEDKALERQMKKDEKLYNKVDPY